MEESLQIGGDPPKNPLRTDSVKRFLQPEILAFLFWAEMYILYICLL